MRFISEIGKLGDSYVNGKIDTIMLWAIIISILILIFSLYIKWNTMNNVDCPSCKSRDSYKEPTNKEVGNCLNCDFSETQEALNVRQWT